MTGEAQHSLIFGGSRSGKTFLIVSAIVNRALRAKYTRHLCARLRTNAVRASVWLDTFPKVMRLTAPGVVYRDHRQDGYAELSNGSQIWFGGLDDKDRVEKILGQEYATIYAGECSQLPYSSILVMRTRLAQPGTGLKLRAFYDLNPVGQKHWTHTQFIEKRDPVTRLPLTDPDNYVYATINPDSNPHLDPSYLASLANLPGRYRDRFYSGKYVVEIDGALWTSDVLEMCRIDPIDPADAGAHFTRVAVAVDPSGAKNKADKKSDEIGIVVAGLRPNKTAVVLEDASMRGGPNEWATRVAAMFKKWGASIIVGEGNFGGEMVRSTIKAVNPNLPVKLVTASRGKSVRAEPIATLYSDDRVQHAGRFNDLEEQLCQFSNAGYKGERSPDRGDALVWCLTELMLGSATTGLLDYYQSLAAEAQAMDAGKLART